MPFLQLQYKPEKNQASTGFEPMTWVFNYILPILYWYMYSLSDLVWSGLVIPSRDRKYLVFPPGGGLPYYESDGDARRLALGV